MNSLAIPRVAKQAVGAITKLVHEDGRIMTVNVEYNQLDPLLRATGFTYPHPFTPFLHLPLLSLSFSHIHNPYQYIYQ